MTAKRIGLADLPDWPALMNPEHAAAYCSLSPSAFDKHVRPHISIIHLGKSVRFGRAAIDRFIAEHHSNDEGFADPQKALEALNG